MIPSEAALGERKSAPFKACTAAHFVEEFLAQEARVRQLNSTVIDGLDPTILCSKDSRVKRGNDNGSPRLLQSFGLHPQEPLLENLPFLEGLLQEKRIAAIGECGLDFFTKEFSEKAGEQEKAFGAQLDFAARYGVPAIVHARKAIQEIFESAAALKKVPAVIFHSFAGTPADARSLLAKGINAYFSFGKPLMNGAKKAIACVRSLEIERILLETDAPYQTLKGEAATSPAEIADVYQAAFEIRNAGIPFEARPSFMDFAASVEKNFDKAFGLNQ
ncbi:MAG: TatD family hydrolase [Treponema sp.]|nr:TatD family hydrolase [Treponema sp.]